MRVLFTGASSAPGERVLSRLLDQADYSEIWCGVNRRDISVTHPKLRKFSLDLTANISLEPIPQPLDLVIHFAPVHLDDFVECVFRLIGSGAKGVKIVELCGPERLNGVTLALRLARKYIAAPLPVWWPAVTVILKALSVLGLHPATPDQISRLVGPKTASVWSEECRSSHMIRFPQNATV